MTACRFLVTGVGPIPPEMPGRVYAPGLRIWGMARELARAGHPVRLVVARFGEAATSGEAVARRFDLEPAAEPVLPEGVTLSVAGGAWGPLLAREAEEFGAQAAAGSTDIMNFALASAGLEIPIWMDYLGDPMAERQMLAYVHQDDAGLAAQWDLLAPALARADRLSGCSRTQCAAILGQLAAIGRLDRHTALESIVHCLDPWIMPMTPDPTPGPHFRGRAFPQDAFVAIQTGGFNTWLDHQTLFAALEEAMALSPRVHFALAGGGIPGHFEEGFLWFEAAVAASRFCERFHLLGWLKPGQVPHLIAEADLGLNIDHPCPEGVLGTRSRLLDWLCGALPVMTTPGCEFAEDLGRDGHLMLVPHRDPAAIGAAIARAVATPASNRERARAGSAFLKSAYSPAECLRPLVEWAVSPTPASDVQAWRAGSAEPSSLTARTLDAVKREAEERRQAQRLAWLEARLAQLEGSRLVQWALKLRGRHDPEGGPTPDENDGAR